MWGAGGGEGNSRKHLAKSRQEPSPNCEVGQRSWDKVQAAVGTRTQGQGHNYCLSESEKVGQIGNRKVIGNISWLRIPSTAGGQKCRSGYLGEKMQGVGSRKLPTFIE